METYIAKDFGKLLKRNALQTRRIMKSFDTNAMRVYDKNIDSLQVSVDLYGNYARITDYSSYDLSEDEITEICDIVSRNLYVEHEKIVYHRRQKREKGEQHQQLEDESLLVTVQENGLSFIVDLTKRIDTGLFLDHMISRKSLMENCKGLNVLNLFSYTGAFSVYAAKGGAASVTSVDLSATYCQWCEKNLQLNGFTGKQYCVINTDALSFISAEKEAGKKYDIIIFDPPSFSNSRKMENDFDVQRDYLDVITSLHALLVPKGAILFSTNLSSFTLDKRRIHGYQVREITKENAAPGFSKKKNSLRSWILEKYNEDAVLEKEQLEENQVLNETQIEENQMLDETQKEEEVAPLIDIANDSEEELDIDFILADEMMEDEPQQEAKYEKNDGKNTRQRRYERRHPGEVAADRKVVEEKTAEKSEKADPFASLQWESPKGHNKAKRDRRPSDKGRTFDRDRRSNDRERSFDRDRRPFDRDRRPNDRDRSFDRDRRPFDRDRRPNDRDRSFDRDRRPFDRDRRPNDRDRSFDRDRRPFDRDRRPNDRDRSFDRDRRPYDRDRSFDRDRRPLDRDRRPYDRDRSFDRDRRPLDRDRRPNDRDRSFDRDRRPFDRDRRPNDRDRSFDRDRRPFDRDRRPNDRDRSFDRDRRPNDRDRSFDRDRRPFDRDRRPFDRDRRPNDRDRSFDRDRRPFDRDRRPNDRDRSYNRDRRPFDRDRRPNDRDRSFDRDRRPFDRDGGSFNKGKGNRSRPKPYGFDRFSTTRTRGGEEDRRDSEE